MLLTKHTWTYSTNDKESAPRRGWEEYRWQSITVWKEGMRRGYSERSKWNASEKHVPFGILLTVYSHSQRKQSSVLGSSVKVGTVVFMASPRKPKCQVLSRTIQKVWESATCGAHTYKELNEERLRLKSVAFVGTKVFTTKLCVVNDSCKKHNVSMYFYFNRTRNFIVMIIYKHILLCCWM